jgi:hypothetical protein
MGMTADRLRNQAPTRPCDVPHLVQALRANDGALWLEEYPTVDAAADRCATVGPGGRWTMPVGGMYQRRVRMPGSATTRQGRHWYRAGRLVVEYAGDEVAVLTALAEVLGPQIAGS